MLIWKMFVTGPLVYLASLYVVGTGFPLATPVIKDQITQMTTSISIIAALSTSHTPHVGGGGIDAIL
jgi:hypothetical protein